MLYVALAIQALWSVDGLAAPSLSRIAPAPLLLDSLPRLLPRSPQEDVPLLHRALFPSDGPRCGGEPSS